MEVAGYWSDERGNDWLSKLILKQERSLRKEYEEKYLAERKKKRVAPLRYAPWRQRKIEPWVLELLIEEEKINRTHSNSSSDLKYMS